MSQAAHTELSSYREAILEHLLVGSILSHLWRTGPIVAEVMKPHVDSSGYDLVVEANRTIRHIQLKTSFVGSTTSSQKVNLQLASKPSGCVIWTYFDRDSLELGPFLWFGGPPGEPLPQIDDLRIGRHTKADSTGRKAERKMIRVVPKGRFEMLDRIEQIVERLFGPTAPSAPPRAQLRNT